MAVTTPAIDGDDLAGDPASSEPFPTLPERLGAWWARRADALSADPWRAAEAAVSVAAVVLATALVASTLEPSVLFSDSTPTGGDMGSHVWGPRYLIDHLLPNLRLSGWTPDWYSGFPAYQFYMVVPSLIVVALHVGLPWFLVVPAVGLAVVVALGGWLRERLYPKRFALLGLGVSLAVLVIPLSYNRAFKLTTALGLLGLPLACWLLARAAEMPFPIPPLSAVAGLIFIFNREPLFNDTGNIIGGNFQSTMAGEFAFSVSLTLSVLYLAVAVRGLRTGRHRALAAALFALAGLCHLIPAFFVLGCTAALFVVYPGRARFRWLVTMVPVAGLLTAFWVLPFWWQRDYVNDMGWERLPLPRGAENTVGYYLVPGGLRYLMVAALVGVAVSLIRRYSVGLVLAMAWVGVAVAFAVLPQARLWNARLLPFMYLSIALLAAIGVGEVLRTLGAAASGNVRRPMRILTVGGSSVVVFGALLYVALPIGGVLDGAITRRPVPGPDGTTLTESSWAWFSTTSAHPGNGWATYNYAGLEGKAAQPAGCDAEGSTVPCTSGGWDEYQALVQTMAGIGASEDFGCGRAFWEYDKDRLGGYGTPMALMMLPYFTDGCIGSQEGLYFESSTTVPHHFLMQAELSTAPSSPQRDLPYPGFDIDAGVRHLQLMGVRYYLAVSDNAVDQASQHPDLTEIAVSGPWHVFEVADTAPIVPLAFEPVVAEGMGTSQHGWLPTASAWFLQDDAPDVVLAADGPDAWSRVQVRPIEEPLRRIVRWTRDQLGETGPIDQVPELPRRELPEVAVSDVAVENDRMAFTVSEPGVPILVRTSYFPNWNVDGADGPYRVTPNLMVVVPTDTEVTLTFGREPVDLVALALTLLGLVGLVWLVRQPTLPVPPDRATRLSNWIDDVLTLAPSPAAVDDARDDERPPAEAQVVDDDIWTESPPPAPASAPAPDGEPARSEGPEVGAAPSTGPPTDPTREP